MSDNATYQKCAAQHFGPWMIEPKWFAQAVAAVKNGTFKPETGGATSAFSDDPAVVGEHVGDEFKVRYYIDRGIARVPFFGQVTKGMSSFGGVSSVWTRQSLRKAVDDDRVSAILLHIDSPGGTVAGTGDLAAEVAAANAVKPVFAYIEDLGASAAYWVASQAGRIFANPTAQIGSIGTMTWVEDTSGMYEKAGVKVTLVSTGKFKGAWIDGIPVSEEYIQSIRTEIEDLNEHFLAGVMAGRKMSRDTLAEIADGRVWIADKAKQLGLIDEVASLDAALTAALKEISTMPITREQFDGYAAENPEAVQRFVTQGYEKAKAELAKPATVAELKAAFPGRSDFVLAQAEAGATLAAAQGAYAQIVAAESTAQAEQLAVLKAENEKLKLAVANPGQGPIPVKAGAGGNDNQVSAERKKELLGTTTLGRSVLNGGK